jgi:ribosomal protein S18 acetylase RimI-like enzyme
MRRNENVFLPVMEQVLDNPIFNALDSGNENFSAGNDRAKFFLPDIALFAGLKEYAKADFDMLYRISPPQSSFILFAPAGLQVPEQWKTAFEMKIIQMVYDRAAPLSPADHPFMELQEQHIPAMLALTKMTNPGPFLPGTIRLGNYAGIFDGDRLVAMAGQRLQPKPYVEISAVCTHPDHLGKGYASVLIADQVRRILAGAGIPFLHVRDDNASAIRLYEKLGFAVRRQLTAYSIRKQR